VCAGELVKGGTGGRKGTDSLLVCAGELVKGGTGGRKGTDSLLG
jgi:hypothetical protein